jgi:hypothetical protein
MGAMQVVSAMGTAIGATIAALTAVTGDSLAVPNFDLAKKAYLLQVWCDVQVAGTLRIRSPKFHDNVNGIRIDTVVSDAQPLLPWGCPQQLFPNDQLTVELGGSAVAGDIETVSMLQVYDDLPGINGRFLNAADLLRRMEQLLTVENTIATGTTGGYTGAEAINSEIDQFQNGVDYALLGFKCDTEVATIGWRAPDFGNLRIGGPGDDTNPRSYSDWFVKLSNIYGRSLIPVFNGQNKASVLVDTIQDENGADTTITTYLARLKAA